MESVFRAGLFADRVVLVTGGGTGIGRAIARELAVLERHGRLDGLVNNAGGQFLTPPRRSAPTAGAAWST